MTNNKKILIVFGTRPEAIKMAPLVKEFQQPSLQDSKPPSFQIKVCVTAQHREMLDQVLEIFDIAPDYDLDIMKPGQDLFDVTSNVLLGMRTVLEEFKPDVVLVHGDTTTSLAAALAAFYKQIKVGHVEAGLRTYDLLAPWPEEANRQLSDRITTFHFIPTRVNEKNLFQEHMPDNHFVVTGNTVIDALKWVVNKIENNLELESKITEKIKSFGYKNINLITHHPSSSNAYAEAGPSLVTQNERKLILITGHRRENFGYGFINMCQAMKEIARNNPDFDLVYPVHLNPNVRKPVNEVLKGIDNVYLIEPLDYMPFVYLMKQSYLVLTDSGGIQEEAPGLGKPVLVMRDTTERPEGIEAGTVKLVGTNKHLIVEEVRKLIDHPAEYEKMSKAHNPYGDGKASKRIVDYLVKHL